MWPELPAGNAAAPIRDLAQHARLADPRALYEALYCARAEAENRIGEWFELFADHASSAMRP